MTTAFLADRDGRTWESDRIDQPVTYHLGEGPSQLEVVAHLYGLTREHVEVIFETFHAGWDYEGPTRGRARLLRQLGRTAGSRAHPTDRDRRDR